MSTRVSLPRRVGLVLLLTGLVAGGYLVGRASAAQPHMVAALNALQTARAELQEATDNKGGHKLTALQRIDEAINQVRLGIAAAGG